MAGMQDKDYRSILNSLEEALRLAGDEPPAKGRDLRLYTELRKIRETLIRVQRDSLDTNIKRPDSRSPLGV